MDRRQIPEKHGQRDRSPTATISASFALRYLGVIKFEQIALETA
jgi:hypothetical protein